MTIVCGTDFSRAAGEAAQVACALARRSRQSVLLIHVIDELGAELAFGTGEDAIYQPIRDRLAEEARGLASSFSVKVEPVTTPGIAHRELVEVAERANATLLVLATRGSRLHRWAVGSTAERVVQNASVPTLVVRRPARLLAWASGERVLSVMVGVANGPTSKKALAFARGLADVGPCELLITQVAWAAGEYYRFGVAPPVPVDRLRPELETLLLRDLRTFAGELAEQDNARFLVVPGLGRVDTHLTLAAADHDVDLLVVGNHQRSTIARLWQSSVSRGVLHDASTNVLSVPRSVSVVLPDSVPTYRNVLVATDLSELSRAGIGAGYGLVAPGGVVHLTYVRGPSDTRSVAELEVQLEGLIPSGATFRGVTTEIEIVEDEVPSLGICRAGSRLGVDAICMATHGRTGVTRLLMGSQAQDVVQRASVPVLLVPPLRPR